MLLFIALFMAGIAGFRIDSPDYENYYLYFNMLSKGIDYRQINIVAPDPAFALLNNSCLLFNSLCIDDKLLLISALSKFVIVPAKCGRDTPVSLFSKANAKPPPL